MVVGGGDEPGQWNMEGPSSQEEKIYVSVRLRPLNEKEIARNDFSDWECINNNTVLFKNNLPERSLFPTAYNFDRVFHCDCSTEEVYSEGAKDVALSVVSGINSSIFAYGQTSSGKTYTMRGITEHAIADIYDYIEKHNEREFILKFSAMEIYNEAVRDLLSSDSTPLRLLDDPERGTVVERLTEEFLKDSNHLQDLLAICDAQRQIGETALNETSSRSHQILRLTIESSARESSRAGTSSTLSASVNFVDLAGSERASQTLSGGARLKEGCHINRSLLTLGTVIRKLSKGKNGHVPYRDSKLTRILQNSIGGNARTAIICTMSPARSHVEQSRNTLFFASCAKQVTNNAQVNVVMSDKALVKQLQRDLARLESELRNAGSRSGSSESADILTQKELLIQKMDKEIKELIQQRDIAQSRMNELLQSVEERQSIVLIESDRISEPDLQDLGVDNCSTSASSEVVDPQRIHHQHSDSLNDLILDVTEDQFLCNGSSPRISSCSQKYEIGDPVKHGEESAQRTCEDSEDICKEVRCDETEEERENPIIQAGAVLPNHEKKEETLASVMPAHKDETSFSPEENMELKDLNEEVHDNEVHENSHENVYETSISPDREMELKALREKLETYYDEATILTNKEMELNALKKKVLRMQRTIETLLGRYPGERSPCSPDEETSSSGSLKTVRTTSPKTVRTTSCKSACSSKSSKMVRTSSCRSVFSTKTSPPWLQSEVNTSVHFREKDYAIKPEGSQVNHRESDTPLNEAVKEHVTKPEGSQGELEESYSAASNELPRITRAISATELTHHSLAVVADASQSSNTWPLEFERLQRAIIELWDACNVPLVHRTYFFLLFKGDPADSVYMEVELRRLSYLKDTLSNRHIYPMDSHSPALASSLKDLNRERVTLSKRFLKTFSTKERENLFQQWGIGLNTKQRRLQLARRLWTDTRDMAHIQGSAEIVARLVGLVEPDKAPKEMFGLSISPQCMSQRSYSRRHGF